MIKSSMSQIKVFLLLPSLEKTMQSTSPLTLNILKQQFPVLTERYNSTQLNCLSPLFCLCFLREDMQKSQEHVGK